jgi:hypothetical protein
VDVVYTVEVVRVSVGEALDRALMGMLVDKGDELIVVEFVKRAAEVGVERMAEADKEVLPFLDRE